MSRQVLFTRHVMPAVDESVSSRQWPLSDEGREAAQNCRTSFSFQRTSMSSAVTR